MSEHPPELCSNWWPDLKHNLSTNIPGMPHPLCYRCANWLPEIEDIGPLLEHTTLQTHTKIGCGNNWPHIRNIYTLKWESSKQLSEPQIKIEELDAE